MPGSSPETYGCTTMRCDCCAATVACVGRFTNQLLPSSVVWPEVKVSAALVRFDTVTSCEPGDSLPAAPVKMSPEGCTMGPGLEPAGSTLSTTETVCGELSAPGAEMDTCP